MNIILTNLSGIKTEDNGRIRHLVKAGSRWPMTVGTTKSVDYYPFPFYLSYSTAILKREHPDANIKGIDGVARDYTSEELYEDIKENPPDIFIAEVTMITLLDDLKFIERVKNEFQCLVIITGVYVTSFQEKVLEENSFIDFCLYGEYEMSLMALVGCLLNADNQGFKTIDGLIYRKNGDIIKSAVRASIKDLDALPFPDREDFPITMYADFSLHSSCAHMTATRGCPAGCIFCVERHVIYNSPKYRTRNPKSVVDEMELLIKNQGARQFYFDDQSFVVNKKFVMAFAEELMERKLNIPWACMGDAMFCDFEMLKAMADSGCVGMKFGIESANEEILKRMGKPLNTDKALQVAKWCKALGIITHATFCIGLPGENEMTIKETIDYMDQLDVDSAQVSKAVPYPGTPLYKWAMENNYLVTDNLDLYDGASRAVLSYPDLPAERIDYWYNKILKKVSRKRLMNYIKHPMNSFEIIYNLQKEKGPVRALQSITTFVARTC